MRVHVCVCVYDFTRVAYRLWSKSPTMAVFQRKIQESSRCSAIRLNELTGLQYT